MGKRILVEGDINVGEALVRELDRVRNLSVDGALWLLDPETEEWRLIVVLGTLDKLGSRKTYRRMHGALHRATKESDVGVNDVFLLSPSNAMIRDIAKVVSTPGAPEVGSIRLASTSVNGRLIPDAYVYRVHLPGRRSRRLETTAG